MTIYVNLKDIIAVGILVLFILFVGGMILYCYISDKIRQLKEKRIAKKAAKLAKKIGEAHD